MNLTIKVGEHEVAVTAKQIQRNIVEFTAVCGDTTRQGIMNVSSKHDYTEEQLRIDVNEFAQRLAEEAAGHEQSAKLLGGLFGERTPGA